MPEYSETSVSQGSVKLHFVIRSTVDSDAQGRIFSGHMIPIYITDGLCRLPL